jgi:histidyl-tRNA synthetase
LAESLGSKVAAPGIGFSIGEDRLVMSVEDHQVGGAGPDVLIAPLGEQAFRHASSVAREIRRGGGSVELLPEGKLKKGLELANKLGARYTLILGDDEIAQGRYALRNMASGEQVSVDREELIKQITWNRP